MISWLRLVVLWLATRPAVRKEMLLFSWPTASASVVPAAKFAVTAEPPATATFNVPETVSDAEPKAKVAVPLVVAVGTVGVGLVSAVVVPAVVVAVDVPTLAVLSEPMGSLKVV